MNMIIDFYNETLQIAVPQTFQNFKEIIALEYSMDMKDVEELILYYKDSEKDKKNFIQNEAEYIKLGILFDKIKVNHLDEFHSQLKKINDDDIRR